MFMDATDMASETDVQGRQPPEPGMYHAILRFVDASFAKHNAVIVRYEMLAGSVNAQEGRELLQYMFAGQDGGVTPELQRFALATRILQPGGKGQVNFMEAQDRQVVISIERAKKKHRETGEMREYTQISRNGLDIWNPKHPDVADVPKDLEMLRRAGKPQEPCRPNRDSFDDVP